MKIPLKAFILISPYSPYPDSNNIKIGGVASSAQGERAGEESSIVVPLTGSYDFDDLIKEVHDRIEEAESTIDHYAKKVNLTPHELKNLSDRKESLNGYENLRSQLLIKRVEDLTNLTHFSDAELLELGVKSGTLTPEGAMSSFSKGEKLGNQFSTVEQYIQLVNGVLQDQDGKLVSISDFSGFHLKK